MIFCLSVQFEGISSRTIPYPFRSSYAAKDEAKSVIFFASIKPINGVLNTRASLPPDLWLSRVEKAHGENPHHPASNVVECQ
jgi:hypothetical protein